MLNVLNTITFYVEDDNNEEVDFTGETLTFTLPIIKICTIKGAFRNLKLKVIVLMEDIDLLQKTFMVI